MGRSQNTSNKKIKNEGLYWYGQYFWTPYKNVSHLDTCRARDLERQAFLPRRQGPDAAFHCYLHRVGSKKNIFLETKTIHALFTTLAAEVAASATHSTQDGRTKKRPGRKTTKDENEVCVSFR